MSDILDLCLIIIALILIFILFCGIGFTLDELTRRVDKLELLHSNVYSECGNIKGML